MYDKYPDLFGQLVLMALGIPVDVGVTRITIEQEPNEMPVVILTIKRMDLMRKLVEVHKNWSITLKEANVEVQHETKD